MAWPWLSGRVTIPWDAKAHFQAQLQFLADSLHRGEAPFWNPFVFAGSPQIADPQSLIFSPPHLLLALLDPAPSLRAADGLVLGMLLLGAAGVVLLFRDRGWHWGGAVVAALSFAFGCSAAWRIQHTGQVLSLSYLPLAWWALDRALDRRSLGYGFLSGLIAGVMVLGRDQIAWLGVYLLAGVVLWRWATATAKGAAIRASVPLLAAGTVGGLLVTGVPLLMTVLLAGDSNRPAIDYEGAARGSLHPASLLTAFAANLFGTDGPLVDFWGPPSPAWGSVDLFLARNMGDIYFGAIPLLAILALGVARGAFAARDIRFALVALALLLLYALGRYTPAFAVLFHLPGSDLFRRPADATFVIGALAAILAGYSIHRLLSGTLPPFTPRRMALAAALVAAGLVGCVAVAWTKDRLAAAIPPLAIACAFLAASAAAFAIAVRWSRSAPTVSVGLLAAVLVADLAVNNGPNESTALPPAVYDVLQANSRNVTIALLKQKLAETAAPDRRDRIELAGVDFQWPNASMVHRLDNTLGYNPIRLDIYSRATGAQDHVALPSQRTFAPLMPSYRSLLADLLGLRFIVTRGDVAEIDPTLKPGDLVEIARTPDGRIYENPRALPRVLFAAEARKADFAALLRTGAWPSFDPTRTVLLEDAPAARPLALAPAGRVEITRYANTKVAISALSDTGGYVVLNDVWHPWWIAEVDGRPAPLLRANAIFRAVQVPPGAHEVRFVFRPLAGAWGALLDRLGAR
ncbi:YfhO family protein [Alsobacter soli]|uniref:YfhO family protein n=1 Tax=Alsobacter soli TaxID=2109933 RepID=UPI001FDF3370|nr:YfhO family protein [Alsobacter soli]